MLKAISYTNQHVYKVNVKQHIVIN